MRRSLVLSMVVALVLACRPLPKPKAPTPQPPAAPAPPATTFVQVFAGDPALDNKLPGATVVADGVNYTADGAGNVIVPASAADICAHLDGYDDACGKADSGQLHLSLVSRHFDPMSVSTGQLAAVRGAMWSARLDLPYGPRPGQPSNILPFDFYFLYSAADRQRMIAAYKARGYTHVVVGPMAGTDCYHNLYPCHAGAMPQDSAPSQEQWDAFLDSVQELWDAGLIPIYFAKPDGWEKPQYAGALDALDALQRQDRSQRLLRVVVYPGWEPSGEKYGWTNAVYVQMAQRGAAVFPNAVRFLHTVCDLDAPTGGNDDQTLGPNGNAVAWQRVAPFIHGWFIQACGYVDAGSPTPTSDFLGEWAKLIQRAHNGFYNGYAGWPRGSAWGPNTPLLVIAAEYASYVDFWKDYPEDQAKRIGDAAMAAGSDGYLDGGTVAVPIRR